MSLINDVLRDLERRGADAPAPVHEARAPRRAVRLTWLWWVAAAILAGVVLHLVLGDSDDGSRGSGERFVAEAGVAGGHADAESGSEAVEKLLPRAARADEAPVRTGPRPRAPGTAEEPESAADGATAEPSGEAAEATPEPEAATESARTPVRSAPTESAPQSAPAAEQNRGTGDGRIVIRRSGGARASAEEALDSAERALQRGQTDLAVSRLQDLLADHPDNSEGRALLARVLLEQRRYREADDLLRAGLKHQPDESRFAYILGRLLMEQGRLSEARTLLVKHTPPVDADPEYHLLLAAVYRQGGEDEAAEKVYRQVTESAPGLGTAWVGLGVTLESRGDGESARAAYRRALAGNDPRAAAFARQRLAVMKRAPDAEDDDGN